MHSRDDAFDRVPAALRTNTVDVLYVTDRKIDGHNAAGPVYKYGRSHSLGFGSCVVEIGRGTTWSELVRASRSRSRRGLPLTVRQVRETGRFPEVPYPLVESDSRLVEDPKILLQEKEATAKLHQELHKRLAQTDWKDVVVYVHGFNNTFQESVFSSAELWHFMGRQGVAICYTWPSGRALSTKGYNYDNVSSEFTVFHLKQLLRALGQCEAIGKVHILGHSRGTAVVTEALCDLRIEHMHAEKSAREALKLGNVVLAAPDLDVDVVRQRLSGEQLAYLPEQFTVYTSPTDLALAAANYLTLGVLRLGSLQPTTLDPEMKEIISREPMTFVAARVASDVFGHSYFTHSPAVASDLILVLRDGAKPGAAHGRPLKECEPNFREIRDDYLREREETEPRP
ncbi:MAG TPA: alpha/beta hydrolase [Phycisphaerae bacterium]|nr:alpha/beta hydrolase [Phycisphaerae bacterium]